MLYKIAALMVATTYAVSLDKASAAGSSSPAPGASAGGNTAGGSSSPAPGQSAGGSSSPAPGTSAGGNTAGGSSSPSFGASEGGNTAGGSSSPAPGQSEGGNTAGGSSSPAPGQSAGGKSAGGKTAGSVGSSLAELEYDPLAGVTAEGISQFIINNKDKFTVQGVKNKLNSLKQAGLLPNKKSLYQPIMNFCKKEGVTKEGLAEFVTKHTNMLGLSMGTFNVLKKAAQAAFGITDDEVTNTLNDCYAQGALKTLAEIEAESDPLAGLTLSGVAATIKAHKDLITPANVTVALNALKASGALPDKATFEKDVIGFCKSNNVTASGLETFIKNGANEIGMTMDQLAGLKSAAQAVFSISDADLASTLQKCYSAGAALM